MIALAWVWGLVWLIAAAVCLRPLADRWLASVADDECRLIRWPLTVGLSLGALTLWLLIVGFWQVNVWIALAFPAAAVLSAWVFSPRKTQRTRRDLENSVLSVFSVVKKFLSALLHGELKAWALAAGLAALAVVLGQATYYPFIGDDEISRYAYYAKLIFTRGHIADDIRGYPMFLPLAYAYVFLVTGQAAEQLAKLIPVLLSACTVLATAALGRRWFGSRGAWASALMLVLTPLYLRWSPDGYVDIPCALYFVLGAYAADVWLEKREMRWALLAGAMAGLALWTKQAGFAMLPSLGAISAFAMLSRSRVRSDDFSHLRQKATEVATTGRFRDLLILRRWSGSATTSARDGLIALVAAFVVGGLWYVRNAYYDGWINAVPGPGPFYTQLANRSPAQLIPFVGEFRAFGVLASPLYLAGLVWGIVSLRGGVLPPKQSPPIREIASLPAVARNDTMRSAWLLIWSIPYTLLWWWLFSYDPRFLLTVLPFFALLVGGMIAHASEWWERALPAITRWILIALMIAGVGFSIVGAQLGGLRQWITAPTASYADRLKRAKGDLYPTVEFLRDNVPTDARVASIDGRYRYYFIDRPIDVFYPSRLSDLSGYDYFVVGSWWSSAYARLGEADGEVVRALDDPTLLKMIYFGPTGSMAVYRVLFP